MTRIRRGLVGPGCLPTRLDRQIADDVAFLVWDYGVVCAAWYLWSAAAWPPNRAPV
jgi:hypothetical protein